MAKKPNGRRRWSADEISLLRELYPTMSPSQLSQRLTRPLTAVRQRAYEMGLKTDGFNYWSKKDEQFLKEHFSRRNTPSIAEELGRSLQAVKGKAQRMGLKKSKGYI